jgi:hypothetical protein
MMLRKWTWKSIRMHWQLETKERLLMMRTMNDGGHNEGEGDVEYDSDGGNHPSSPC